MRQRKKGRKESNTCKMADQQNKKTKYEKIKRIKKLVHNNKNE